MKAKQAYRGISRAKIIRDNIDKQHVIFTYETMLQDYINQANQWVTHWMSDLSNCDVCLKKWNPLLTKNTNFNNN